MARLFLIDALGIAYRAFHAIRTRVNKTPEEIAQEQEAAEAEALRTGSEPRDVNPFKWVPLQNSREEPTNAIYGFANSVLKIRREEEPELWALAWDGPGPTFRHARYEGYKATRKPMPDDLYAQMPVIEDLAQALGLPVLELPGFEADDVMASLACRAEREGHEVVLVTSDKDMLQIVTDRVKLWRPMRSGDDYLWVDRASIEREWSVRPEQVRDVLALMGDSIDNVPGVPGVGQKTAADLIGQFGSIDGVYERIAEVKRPALRQKLMAHRDAVMLSRELVTVKIDCDLPWDWEALRRGPVRREALQAIARRYELVRLEKIANEEGVDEAEAGELPIARSAARRATANRRGSVQSDANGTESPWVGSDDETGGARAAPREPSPGDATVAEPRVAAAPTFAGGTQVERDAEASIDAPRAVSIAPSPTPARPMVPPFSSGTRAAPTQESLDLWGRAASGLLPEVGLEAWEKRLHAVRARAIHGLALLPIIEGADPRAARLIGLAIAARGGTTCYLPLAHAPGPNFEIERAREWIGPMLSDPTVPKVGEDLKAAVHALAGADLELRGLALDAHVASFLCDPERDHSLTGLARDVIGVALPKAESIASARRAAESAAPGAAADPAPRTRRVPISTLPPETVGAWAEAAVGALFGVADGLQAQLEARGQWTLYQTLEHPLIPVLVDMERAGVLLDTPVLAKMAGDAGEEIARLEEELFEMAGERFNLNSGPQLSRVLFEKLGFQTGRRTKTGFSTDQAVLEELAQAHPFPKKLLEYRALTKLKSTYLDSLPSMVDPRDGRVHTTYHQTGASTGRLSSSNPNLQNIPMRSALGRAIRKGFVAPPGRTLVGADYSQIELRVMAHLSEDPQLSEAFHTGEDVHASTARRVFGITGDLDPGLRSRAKIVNFGVMYGMGPRSLSQQMGISLAEAQEFIAHYFRAYARVREFLDRTVQDARRNGYVETLFGRRRYLPGLNEAQGAARAFAERVAINAPIQGSAADLMKLAMIRVHAALKRSHPSARLLLQVHDELVLECALDEADEVSARVRQEMEGCYPMRVPLEVSVGRGATWFDVH
jgi:DNA polymerase I